MLHSLKEHKKNGAFRTEKNAVPNPVDYTDTFTKWTHICHKYLRENKKIFETIFACSYGALVEFFDQKNKSVENLVTLSL